MLCPRRYPHTIVQGIAANPEFPTHNAAARQSALVAQQLFALRNAVNNLRNAYNGLDVEWNDVGECLRDVGERSARRRMKFIYFFMPNMRI